MNSCTHCPPLNKKQCYIIVEAPSGLLLHCIFLLHSWRTNHNLNPRFYDYHSRYFVTPILSQLAFSWILEYFMCSPSTTRDLECAVSFSTNSLVCLAAPPPGTPDSFQVWTTSSLSLGSILCPFSLGQVLRYKFSGLLALFLCSGYLRCDSPFICVILLLIGVSTKILKTGTIFVFTQYTPKKI